MQTHHEHLKPINEYISPRHFRDEVTYNKIQRHLIDINDSITDEDIRNIKILVAGKQIEDKSAELEKMIRS